MTGSAGKLYVVATPIGNLEDVTLRALRILAEVDGILAEDTRHTRTLLERHGITTRARSLHAHNEAARIREVLEGLGAGQSLALVSDAGTPLVSDPGARVVVAAAEAGFAVVTVPGPSAVLAALSVAGLQAHPFAFLGFPPRKAGARRRLFDGWCGRPETLVLFESPKRLGDTLRAAAEVLGERRACVARELTKLHEEAARGSLAELAERFASGTRGECTIVIEGDRGAARELDEHALDERIRTLRAAGESARDIASLLAEETGTPRRTCYSRVLALFDEEAEAEA